MAERRLRNYGTFQGHKERELLDLNYFSFDDATIYRGSLPKDRFEMKGDDVYIVLDSLPSSWTLDREMAKNFSSFIVDARVSSGDVLIDTTMIDPRYMIGKLGGWPEEKEIIMLPGIYLTNLSPDQIVPEEERIPQ